VSYPIVPLSAVGVDDAFDIRLDAGDIERSFAGPILKALGVPVALLPPLATGWRGTPLPKPVQLYFKFGAPIETSALAGRADDEACCRDLRDRVKAAVESGIEALLALRERGEAESVS